MKITLDGDLEKILPRILKYSQAFDNWMLAGPLEELIDLYTFGIQKVYVVCIA